MMKRTRRCFTTRLARQILIYLIAGILAAFFLVPLYTMVCASFKSDTEIYSPKFFPAAPTLKNYRTLLLSREFIRTRFDFKSCLMSSFIISSLTVLVGGLVCILGGYSLAKYRFVGRTYIFWIILGSVTIPDTVLIIPIFVLMNQLGLYDTYWALILPYSVSIFGIFLVRQYVVAAVPDELLDAGRIDGCSEMGVLWRIALPIMRPGVAVLALLLWLDSWIVYLWPLIMLSDYHKFPLPLGLASLYGNRNFFEYGVLMAGTTFSILPLLIVFILMQKHFVSGLTEGALK